MNKVTELLMESRRVLGVGSQGAFGELLGASRRTGQRWERGHAFPGSRDLERLARLVFAKDPALAARIAQAAGTTLERLELVHPAPPPAAAAPPPPPPDPVHIVDTVVCAAAEAVDMKPPQIRPALIAAFRRARLAGLSVEAIDEALSAKVTDAS
jgi:hypothetical protein